MILARVATGGPRDAAFRPEIFARESTVMAGGSPGAW